MYPQHSNTTPLEPLAQKYLHLCRYIRNYSEFTIMSYQTAFDLFFERSGVRTLGEYQRDPVERWFLDLRIERNWKSSTFRHYHKRLNTFTNWLVKEKYIDYNFLTEIELPKQEKALPVPSPRMKLCLFWTPPFTYPTPIILSDTEIVP